MGLPGPLASSSLHCQPEVQSCNPVQAQSRDRPRSVRVLDVIVDLSSPQGFSVNDAISSDYCSVTYTSVDQAADMARAMGKGCLMAKLDLKEAYRAVPVHLCDQRLLAVSWQGDTYLDKAPPPPPPPRSAFALHQSSSRQSSSLHRRHDVDPARQRR